MIVTFIIYYILFSTFILKKMGGGLFFKIQLEHLRC